MEDEIEQGKPEGQIDEKETSLRMTPSADDILGVSPVASFDKDVISDTKPATPGRRVSRKKPPMSPATTNPADNISPSRFRTIVTTTVAEDPVTPSRRSAVSIEAFSSSSEDENEVTPTTREAFVASIARKRSRASKGDRFSQSEFDKAAMTGDGVPNVGSASFDVPKDGDFLAQAESSAIQEAMSMDESFVAESPERQRVPRRPHAQGKGSPAGHPPPPPPIRNNMSWASRASDGTAGSVINTRSTASNPRHARQVPEDLSAGVLPDVLMSMRQKIESLTLFDSDMMRLAQGDFEEDDFILQETRETLKRSSQQSISAAVLVSLAHKRYERRRLAAMEIEKVVRGLAHQGELERVRAILLLLSDDYVRSTNEDARKGGVVGLAACAIGLKKASDDNPEVMECRDLILASVVHACQDHSQRVRYYATESLFNVVKVIPSLAVQHFFILFEILRSLYADVDPDVRSGAEFLDKKLKDVIVGAINSGSFSADACVPIFARFVYMRNKATKRLTLTWLQELNEKLIGSPVLEFLHLFLSGIFAMVADPNVSIRQSALAFLQSVLPKLLVDDAAFDDKGASMMKVDFDKILQSLVTTMEHPDPFVRKVAIFWMCRIVKAHMSDPSEKKVSPTKTDAKDQAAAHPPRISAASMSVRNSLPHMLPGVLLSIGDTFHSRTSAKDAFLPDLTTRSLAEQTNSNLQNAVRRDGAAYVSHLDGFIVALREELDSPGGLSARNPPAVERKPYRMDVTPDGTGIESPGWFRASIDERGDESMMMSRLCALDWVVVLYENVVPVVLKAQYAREFITPIIHQLVDNPPEAIIFKSLEVLAKITVPVDGEKVASRESSFSSLLGNEANQASEETGESTKQSLEFPMTDANALFALDVLDPSRRQSQSRDRQVFSVLIRLHAHNHQLVADLSRVVQFMCTLQPPEFVFVSFAVELDRFVRKQVRYHSETRHDTNVAQENEASPRNLSGDLEFVSAFIQQMNHVLLNTEETKELRELLKDCVPCKNEQDSDNRKAHLFHILLYSFSHNLASTVSLCLWGGAYRTAATFLNRIDPLDINLIFMVEVDKLVELLERPLFRHLHVRMLECDKNPSAECSGYMLFRTLKSLLMLVPQSTCYRILRDRLVTVSRFRQSALGGVTRKVDDELSSNSESFVSRVVTVRKLHCDARWETIRAGSLETAKREDRNDTLGESRRDWLGYSTKEEEDVARARYRAERLRLSDGLSIEEIKDGYRGLDSLGQTNVKRLLPNSSANQMETREQGTSDSKNPTAADLEVERQPSDEIQWKKYWDRADAEE